MLCIDVQARLDLLTSGERADGADEVHVQTCADCREVFEQRRCFDRAVRNALQDVPVPVGLEERLLATLSVVDSDGTEAVADAPRPLVVPVRRLFGWKAVSSLVAMLLLAVGVWWSTQGVQAPRQEFAEVQSRLLQELQAPGAMEALAPWDNTSDVSSVERELRRLQVSRPKGVDLDDRPGHDAAVFSFRHQQWTGFLIAIPSVAIQNGPASSVPTLVSQQRLFAWQSTDKNWTYVCRVQSGPVQGLMQSLFGGMA